MRIALKRPYKSIAALETEELPDFAVLVGRNGAGKTQLLEALEKGWAEIPGIRQAEVEMYDMASFSPPNSGAAGRHANRFAIDTADIYLRGGTSSRSPIEIAAEIFEDAVGDEESNPGIKSREKFAQALRIEIQDLPDFSVFTGRHAPTPYHKELYRQVMQLLIPDKQRKRSRLQQHRFKRQQGGPD